MTLQEFFDLLAQNPLIVLFYFGAVPLTAYLAGVFGKGEGHQTPWKELYCFLSYAIAIPGIFAVTLNIYLFLFENRPILETDIFTQILPVLSMIITFLIIRRNVPFELIPGFDKLSGLVMIITALLSLMWFLEKVRLIIFSYMPFYYVILILAAAIIAIRFGAKRMFSGENVA